MLYAVMEFAGEDLSQVLAQRPLTTGEAREMLEPALRALEYLHREGFVHGRLKPANIMAADDQVKLSSDSLRRIGEPDVPRDMADFHEPPEVATGGISPAGDIWSLGVTLIESLTQRAPVRSEAGPPEPIVADGIPEPFLDIARHCLQPNPQDRWTAAGIAARLRPVAPLATEPASVKPRPTFAKWRYIAPAAALGLAAFVFLVGRGVPRNSPKTDATPQARPEQSQAPSEQTNTQPAPAQKTVGAQTNQAPQLDAKAAPGGLDGAQPGRKAPETPVSPPEIVHQVMPEVPQKASNTIQGKVTVNVRVRVDASGDVADAKLDSPQPSKYFVDLALQAVRRWKFRPAKVDDRAAPQEWILRFEFVRGGAKVYPRRLSPG
jgi:TonB family protein